MIRPLRRAHRLMMLGLAVAAPATLSLALANRSEVATVDALPTADADLSSLPELAAHEDLFAGQPLRVRVLASAAGPLLEVRATGPLPVPEPLIYASATTTPGARLPADARLLGSIDDLGVVRGPLRLPGGRLPGSGDNAPARSLWLYSLGHSAVVAVAILPGETP